MPSLHLQVTRLNRYISPVAETTCWDSDQDGLDIRIADLVFRMELFMR